MIEKKTGPPSKTNHRVLLNTAIDFETESNVIERYFIVNLKGLIHIFHQAGATKKMSVALQCATMNKIQEPKSALRVPPVRFIFIYVLRLVGRLPVSTESRIGGNQSHKKSSTVCEQNHAPRGCWGDDFFLNK